MPAPRKRIPGGKQFFAAVSRAPQPNPDTLIVETAKDAALPESTGQSDSSVNVNGTTVPKIETAYKFDTYDVPCGMLTHEIGNVISYEGQELVCESASRSGARFVSVTRGTRIIKTTFNGDKIIPGQRRVLTLSRCHEPSLVTRKLDDEELKEFLSSGKTRRGSDSENTGGENKMPKQKKEKKTKSATKPVSLAGKYSERNDLIRKMFKAGKTKEQVCEAVRDKGYPSLVGKKLNEMWKSMEKKAKVENEPKPAKSKAPKAKKSKAPRAPKKKVEPAPDETPTTL